MAMNTITAVTAMAIKVGLISTEDCGLEESVEVEVEEEDKISIDGSSVEYGEGAGFQWCCGIDAGAELRRSMAVFECKRLEMVGAVSPLLLTFDILTHNFSIGMVVESATWEHRLASRCQ